MSSDLNKPSIPSAFVPCLNANKRLKRLNIYGKCLFDDDLLSTISCKLTELILSFCGTLPHEKRNFNLFLLSQRETVEVLMIEQWMGIEVMQTISLMPRLKEVGLFEAYTYPSEFTAVSFPKNHSVACLHILQGYRYNFEWYKRLIEAYPNLESLRVSVLTDEMADFVPGMCKNLNKLFVENFRVENIQEANEAFYLKLKKFKCLRVHRLASNELLDRLNGTVVPTFF